MSQQHGLQCSRNCQHPIVQVHWPGKGNDEAECNVDDLKKPLRGKIEKERQEPFAKGGVH